MKKFILIYFLLSCFLSYYLNHLDRQEIQLTIAIEHSENSETYDLFISKDTTKKIFNGLNLYKGTSKVTDDRSIITFDVPQQILNTFIRIDFGNTEAVKHVQNITVSTLGIKKVFYPREIIQTFQPINLVFKQNKDHLIIEPITSDPYIVSRDSFAKLSSELINHKLILLSYSMIVGFTLALICLHLFLLQSWIYLRELILALVS